MSPSTHTETGEKTPENRNALFLGAHAHRAFLTACEPPETHHEADPMGPPRTAMAPIPAQRPAARYKVGPSGLSPSGFIQALAPRNWVMDILTAHYQQHLQVTAGEVLPLPLEICAWLQANQPGGWGQMTVMPGDLLSSLGHDGATGLDTMTVSSSAVWGIDASGAAYFTPDGDIGSGEGAYMFVQNGVPVLVQ